MTNPDNVGVLPELPRPEVIDMHFPTGVKIYGYTRDQMRAYGELCRAATAGGDTERGKVDPSWSLFDRVDFALRDAGFDLDEASDIAALAASQESALAGAHTAKDSAPAGSGEVSRLELARMELAVTAALFNYEQGDTVSKWLKNTAALLRKLQQGAE